MNEKPSDRELVLEREIPFPRDLVWKVMTEDEHVNRWWGPDGFRNENVRMDFRVGGIWTFDMVGPDGTRYPNKAEFREITPPVKMVFDHGDGQSVWFEASVALEETDTGTRVILRQVYPSREARDHVVEEYGAIEGGKQHLAKLEKYLMTMSDSNFDPALDIMLERVVDVPPDLLWKAWTTPQHLMPWFCPKPWSVTECRIDCRPGGEFFTIMKGPEAGQEFPNAGCYLEVEANRKLSWTSALGPGFRPVNLPEPSATDGPPNFHFTAVLTFTPEGGGTRYRAVAKHADPKSREVHEAMGFHDGWNTVLDQLVDYCRENF